MMWICKNIAFIFPTVFFLSPFLYKEVGSVLSICSLLVLPAFIILKKLSAEITIGFIPIVFYAIFELIRVNPSLELVRYTYFVLLTILFLKVGFVQRGFDLGLSASLSNGASFFNVLTLSIYIMLLMGWTNQEWIYETLQRIDDIGIARFSLGNAIIVPLFITVLFWYGSDVGAKSTVILGLLNVITATISESRLVIIIAILVFIKIFIAHNKNKKKRSILNICVLTSVALAIFFSIELGVASSIYERFLGNDSGSASERLRLFGLLSNFDSIYGIIFGLGVASSSELVLNTSGEYRTVESFAYQFVYEYGFLGTFIVVWFISKSKPVLAYIKTCKIDFYIAALIIIQTLFLIPLTEITPFIMYMLANMTKREKRVNENS